MFHVIDTKTNTEIKTFSRREDASFWMDRNGYYDVVRYKIRVY